MINDIGSLLGQLSTLHPMLQFLAIVLCVAFCEELAALAVFALARHDALSWWIAGSATFVGAWGAQSLIWLAGRVAGKRALAWRIFRSLEESGKLERIHQHVVREGWIAVVIMRFVPGTRIPVCLGAGILGMGALEFLGVLTLATAAWLVVCMGFAQSFVEALRGRPETLLAGLLLIVPTGFAVRSWFRRRRVPERDA